MRFTLVHDEKVNKFCYWEDGVRQAMQYADEFYQHVATVKEGNRLKAYELSDELQKAGASVCMTVSPYGYSVWQGLKKN